MKELLIVSPGSFMFWLLAVCAVVFTAVFIKKNKNRPENERRKAALVLYGAGLVIYFLYKFALSRDAEYSRILLESGAFGFNWWEELPFQLCNITLLLLPVALWKKKDVWVAYCCYYGVCAGICALIMPVTGFSGASILLPRMAGYYVTHLLICTELPILYGLGIFRPSYSVIPKTALRGLLIILFATGISLAIKAAGLAPDPNYFFSLHPAGNAILIKLREWIPVNGLYLMPLQIAGMGVACVITFLLNLFFGEGGSDWMNDPKKRILLQGFVLSVLLLSFTSFLYGISFRHAAAMEPDLYDVKIPAIDDRIPVIPVFFFGYIWSYVYWFFSPFFILSTGRKKTVDFLITFLAVELSCFLILYFFPSKIDRVAEGLWDPSLKGFFWDLLHICYNVDGGAVAYNLLPSMHCGVSVTLYQALRDENVPPKIRRAAFLSTAVVVISTLFTKQHYFLDAVTGVLIPVLLRPVVLSFRKSEKSRETGETVRTKGGPQ